MHDELAGRVTGELLDAVLALVPDPWLAPDPDRPDPNAPPDPAGARVAYRNYLLTRLERAERWLP